MTTEILSLPDEILDNILSYTSFDEVSHLRLVCKRFDASAQRVLNQGFYRVEKFHAQCLRKVKEQLPRRESERRKHALSAHCDILTAIETRLSLLGMTFMKYVELKYCCFIPGKVLDEIFKILRYVSSTPVPPRSHEILQELRDISSMAMEHFDEKIAPAFRNRRNATPKLAVTSSGSLTGSSHLYGSTSTSTFRNPSVNHELIKVQIGYRQLQNKYMELKKENLEARKKVIEYRKKLNDVDRKVSEQNNVILQQASRISEQDVKINEQDGKINEVNRKLFEFDKYFSDLMLEFSTDRQSNILFSKCDSFTEDKTSCSSSPSLLDKKPELTHIKAHVSNVLLSNSKIHDSSISSSQKRRSSPIAEPRKKRQRTRKS